MVEDPVRKNRLANLRRIVACFLVREDFAKATRCNASQLRQFFRDPSHSSWRPVAFKYARRVEENLGLPALCLDAAGGVEALLPELIGRLSGAGFAVVMPGATPETDQVSVTQAPVRLKRPGLAKGARLKALHAAALEAFEEALAQGRVSDQQCLALMQEWLDRGDSGHLSHDGAPSIPRPATPS